MTTILNVLLEITIYSAILCGAILLFKKVFQRHISATLNYAVWMLLIIRLFIPATIDSGFSLIVMPEPETPLVQNVDMSTTVSAAQTVNTADVSQTSAQGTSYHEQTDYPATVVNQTTPKQAANLKMDWQATLVLLWAAGLLGYAVSVSVFDRRLNRQIERSSMEVPAYVLNIIDECKKDLEIKREIKVTMHDWLNSPALTASLRPRLLLSTNLLSMSRQQVTFGIRHELTHYKRKDHLMILLLILLRCVHWFNPIVWISFPQIQADMETVCDANVTSCMQKTERITYINTMVELSCRTNVRYVLGMGMCKGRKMLEKRIRGIFMKTKTRASVRMAAVIIAGVMLVACFTTACQPTPEKEIVVNRNDLEEKIQAPAPSVTRYEAPTHWIATEERGNLVINVDTDVTLPDVTQYPVTILEPVTFSQERLDELVHYFAGDSKLFCWPSVFTKADYQEMLIEAKRGQLTDGEYVVTEGTKRYAESLEEKIANAPDDSPRIYTDTTLTYDTDFDGNVNYDAGPNYLNVGVAFEDSNEATISAHNFTLGYGNSTSFSFWRIGGPTTESWYQECLTTDGDESESGMDGFGEILSRIDLDKDAARAQAEKVIGDLGIKDMALVNEEKAVLRSLGNQWGVSNDQPNLGGYVFEYVRSSGDIAGYQLTSFGTNGYEQPPDYSPPFFQEMLMITVSENGIESFSWSGLAQVVETVSDNVTLLPFEDVQQALLNQIYYEHAPMLEQFNTSEGVDVLGEMTMMVDVLSAELRIGYISVKDNTRQAMLVPMWVFETAETHSYGDEKGEPFASKTYQFNAIDGGVIMPSVGVVAAEEEAIPDNR